MNPAIPKQQETHRSTRISLGEDVSNWGGGCVMCVKFVRHDVSASVSQSA